MGCMCDNILLPLFVLGAGDTYVYMAPSLLTPYYIIYCASSSRHVSFYNRHV